MDKIQPALFAVIRYFTEIPVTEKRFAGSKPHPVSARGPGDWFFWEVFMNQNRKHKLAWQAAAGVLSLMLTAAAPMASYAGPSDSTAVTAVQGPGAGSSSGFSSGSTVSSVTSPSGTSSGASTARGRSSVYDTASQGTVSVNGTAAVTDPIRTGISTDAAHFGAMAKGVDLSRWNSVTDWSAVAKDGISFAILATRGKGAEDVTFRPNAIGAAKHGIRIGAYIYSYAKTEEEAIAEADFVLKTVKDYPISLPIFFDAEDENTTGTLSKAEVARLVNAFCGRIKEAGYYPALYCNEHWIANKIDMSAVNWDVWVARYADQYTYKKATIWQQSSKGSVNGITGNVDIDYMFRDYSDKVDGNTWRTIDGQRYYYKNHVIQKATWVNDGANWYYADADGVPVAGWLKDSGSYYYLNSDGKMATGWKEINGNWYYLKSSGAMATGWRQIDNNWYYLNSNGVMQTGVQTIGGKTYYLKGDGKMATGWNEIGGDSYYFDADGKMATGWREADGSWYYLKKDGKRQTGWLTQGDLTYYLKGDGRMATGWQEVDGAWYYFHSDGRTATGWIGGNGSWYYLGENGQMKTGWISDKGKWYYLGADGKMLTGWQTIGNTLYHLEDSGALTVNAVISNGQTWYQADAGGACTETAAPGTETTAPQAENAAQVRQPGTVLTAAPDSRQQSGMQEAAPASGQISGSYGPGSVQ